MLKDNIVSLRKVKQWTQEELASRLGITRQTLSKWETGESIPDVSKAQQMAELFDISLDEMLNGQDAPVGIDAPPRGKYAFGMVTVGDKGQIVIPARARRIFNIEPGDRMMLLGDENQGLALISEKRMLHMMQLMQGDEES